MNKKKITKEATLSQQAQLLQQKKDSEAAVSMQGTVAGEIWSEIEGRSIEMFALPNQLVNMHCHPVSIEPTKLYLLTNSTAVLPSLESAIGKEYFVELADKFVIVSRAPSTFKK